MSQNYDPNEQRRREEEAAARRQFDERYPERRRVEPDEPELNEPVIAVIDGKEHRGTVATRLDPVSRQCTIEVEGKGRHPLTFATEPQNGTFRRDRR